MITVEPVVLITNIRESFTGAEYVYTHGSCYKLYQLLKLFYPDAKAMITEDGGHVVTEINGEYYDIHGYSTQEKLRPYSGQLDEAKFSLWDCALECPNCDDIICYSELVVGSTAL